MTEASEMRLLKLSTPHRIYQPCGCAYCSNTGYFGRIGVFETMILNDKILNIIMSDDFSSDKVTSLVAQDMGTVLDHTRCRVLAGETSLEEYEQLMDLDGDIHH